MVSPPKQEDRCQGSVIMSAPMFRTQFYYKSCPPPGTAPASMCSRIVDVVHPTPGAKVVMQSYFLLVVMLELTVNSPHRSRLCNGGETKTRTYSPFDSHTYSTDSTWLHGSGSCRWEHSSYSQLALSEDYVLQAAASPATH